MIWIAIFNKVKTDNVGDLIEQIFAIEKPEQKDDDYIPFNETRHDEFDYALAKVLFQKFNFISMILLIRILNTVENFIVESVAS